MCVGSAKWIHKTSKVKLLWVHSLSTQQEAQVRVCGLKDTAQGYLKPHLISHHDSCCQLSRGICLAWPPEENKSAVCDIHERNEARAVMGKLKPKRNSTFAFITLYLCDTTRAGCITGYSESCVWCHHAVQGYLQQRPLWYIFSWMSYKRK